MVKYLVLHGRLNSGVFYTDNGYKYYVNDFWSTSRGYAKFYNAKYPRLIEFVPDKESDLCVWRMCAVDYNSYKNIDV